MLVNELRSKYPALLGPNVVEEAQVRGLVERLMKSVQIALNPSSVTTATAQKHGTANNVTGTSTGTVMFKRVAAPTSENDIVDLDLNVVSDVSV